MVCLYGQTISTSIPNANRFLFIKTTPAPMRDSINIKVIDRFNTAHDIEVPLGMALSVMEICKGSDLPVEAICGGMALCATCQVYIESDHNLPEPSDDEWLMLDQAMHVQQNSRLGCQLKITEALDGLIVRLAPEQV
jgi:ferredoxin